MRKFLSIILLFVTTLTFAETESVEFKHSSLDFRLAYNIGGTMPLGMPETIRSLERFALCANLSLGVDYYYNFTKLIGISPAIRFENKGMDIRARVKNYHMKMIRGGQSLEGVFTGHNSTKVDEWMFSIPVQLVFNFGEHWRLRFGPYVSFCVYNHFKGYASRGYLRVGDPTGAKVELGEEPSTRGSYDFSDDLRDIQWGLLIGANWYFSKNFGLLVDFDWGLNEIFKPEFTTISQTMYPLFGTIGFTYRIK